MHRPAVAPSALSPRARLLAVVAFAVAVVALPREWIWAHVVALAAVAIALATARVRPRHIARRMLIEIPFLLFAALMPFIATGPRIEVAGATLSIAGLWAGGALLAKATLSVLASIWLIETTSPRQIVLALEGLRLPRLLVDILTSMVRYLDLIADEADRMRIARDSRGFAPRGPRSWMILATAIGALFIRSHGRGERIHLAMLSRGLAS